MQLLFAQRTFLDIVSDRVDGVSLAATMASACESMVVRGSNNVIVPLPGENNAASGLIVAVM